MSRKRGWVASQPLQTPSLAGGNKSTSTAPRVWVRPQADASVGPAVALAAARPLSSAGQRATVGPGKACLAAVLASAGAEPHSQPAAASPQQQQSRRVYLPSPHKLLGGAAHPVQAAANREHVPPAARGAALARQLNSAPQPSRAAVGAQVVSSKRPASKTWVRPDAADPQPAGASQQAARTARPRAFTDSLRQSAP